MHISSYVCVSLCVSAWEWKTPDPVHVNMAIILHIFHSSPFPLLYRNEIYSKSVTLSLCQWIPGILPRVLVTGVKVATMHGLTVFQSWYWRLILLLTHICIYVDRCIVSYLYTRWDDRAACSVEKRQKMKPEK
ncbi:hypothetical protein I7I50_09790 [Histoplasma capsulatum G186AR]|uniref:Uncharacterized protein n=1 Tax=Ajellomyces capsulatus TaxID=5037 RepID=A0A8H7Z384_AJECA|nr:hypothetical protein I7I52_10893 [Histoplasma capsulatum]QSS68727.1 hypothetical protein I7I50_09790 [Histoplasma capsulatum G186AR]